MNRNALLLAGAATGAIVMALVAVAHGGMYVIEGAHSQPVGTDLTPAPPISFIQMPVSLADFLVHVLVGAVVGALLALAIARRLTQGASR